MCRAGHMLVRLKEFDECCSIFIWCSISCGSSSLSLQGAKCCSEVTSLSNVVATDWSSAYLFLIHSRPCPLNGAIEDITWWKWRWGIQGNGWVTQLSILKQIHVQKRLLCTFRNCWLVLTSFIKTDAGYIVFSEVGLMLLLMDFKEFLILGEILLVLTLNSLNVGHHLFMWRFDLFLESNLSTQIKPHKGLMHHIDTRYLTIFEAQVSDTMQQKRQLHTVAPKENNIQY